MLSDFGFAQQAHTRPTTSKSVSPLTLDSLSKYILD